MVWKGLTFIFVGVFWYLAAKYSWTGYTIQHRTQFYIGAGIFVIGGIGFILAGLLDD